MKRHAGHGRRSSSARLRKACGLVAITLVVAQIGVARVAEAAVPKAGLSRETEAYAAFQVMSARMQANGAMPLLSEPSTASVLGTLWDVGILGQPPYTFADNQALQRIWTLQVNVLSQYLKAAQADPNAAAAQGHGRYQAETARAHAFLVSTLPALLESAADGVAKSVDFQHLTVQQTQQLKQFSAGMSNVLGELRNAINTLAMPNVSAESRKEIAHALSQSAGRLAAQLTPAQRAQITRTAARAIAKGDPATMTDLESMITAMSTNKCSALCRIGQVAAAEAPAPQLQPAAQAGAQPVPQPQPVAAAGQTVLVPHPDVGAQYGTQPPYSCTSTTAPRTGPISADLARQYFICQNDQWSDGRSLLLVTNVHVQVGRPLTQGEVKHLFLTEADMSSPTYAIRGSFDRYVCSPLGGVDGIGLGPHDCSLYPNRRATGVCYRNGFGDWSCSMNNSNAQQISQHIAPGPITAKEIAIALQEAPVRQLQSGMQLFMQGNYAGASRAFKSVLDQNVNDPLASLWQGVAQTELGSIWADNSFTAHSAYPAGEELLALSAWRTGKISNATQFLEFLHSSFRSRHGSAMHGSGAQGHERHCCSGCKGLADRSRARRSDTGRNGWSGAAVILFRRWVVGSPALDTDDAPSLVNRPRMLGLTHFWCSWVSRGTDWDPIPSRESAGQSMR